MSYQPTGPDPSPVQRLDGGFGAGQASGDSANGLSRVLGLVAAGLGVLILFLGYLPFTRLDLQSYGGSGITVSGSTSYNFFRSNDAPILALFLIAGLIAGLALLPKQAKLNGVAAAVAVGGFLALVLSAISAATLNGAHLAFGAYVELVLGLLLTVAVVIAMLADADVSAAQRRKAPQSGGFGGGATPYGQSGSPYGPGAGGQYGQQGGSSYGAGHGQFSPPQGPQGSGYYGSTPGQQVYGQVPQQPYGETHQQFGSQSQPQRSAGPAWPQDNGEQRQASGSYAAPSTGSYAAPPTGSYAAPPTGSYAAPPTGSYAAPPTPTSEASAGEDETTVQPRGNPYGPSPQQ